MSLISLIFKPFRKIVYIATVGANNLCARCLFIGNNVAYKSFHTNGIPYVMVDRKSTRLNSSHMHESF